MEAGEEVSLEAVQNVYPDRTERDRRHSNHVGSGNFWEELNSNLLDELSIFDSENSLAKKLVSGFLEDRWWTTYEDAIPTLIELKKQRYKLGVIANALHVLEGRLNHTGLTSHFDSITYSEEVGVAKPHPKIFHVAMESIGCLPNEAVHIGDRWKEDIEGASAVGIKPIFLDRESVRPDVDVWRVQSLSEISELIR